MRRILTLVVALSLLLFGCGRRESPPEEMRPKEVKEAPHVVEPPEEEKFFYESGGMRDPFVPLVDESGKLVEGKRDQITPYRLGGIIWNPDHPLAIIDGEIVGVGDLVDKKAKVVEIKEEEVILDCDGKIVHLKYIE